MKLQQMNNRQYFLCLPNKIVRLKGWNKGDNIVLRESKGEIYLIKKE